MGWNALSLLSDRRGVCLTELVMSLATGAIVLAAAFEIFHIVQTVAGAQQRTMTQQQDLRLALEVFEQEVRLTATEAIVTVEPDQFLFLANLNGQQTTTTGAVLPGQSVLAVQDGSGWGEGKTVILCGRQACEVHRLVRAGQRYQLTLAEAVIYMCLAPKSNSAAQAIWAAMAEVREGRTVPVPVRLRDQTNRRFLQREHLAGSHDEAVEKYISPHDSDDTNADYLGVDRVYYRPTEHGLEARLAERLRTSPRTSQRATGHDEATATRPRPRDTE